MKWGVVWGKRWGFIEVWIINTVDIRKIMGKYIPCERCRWFRNCVVPKGRGPNLRKFGTSASRPIYTCEEYTYKYKA